MGCYQRDDSHGTDRLTNGKQTPNRQLTPNKNVKNEKNERNNYPKVVDDESSDFYQLALQLFENVSRNHSVSRRPDLRKWTNDMKLIVERDQRTIEQIDHLITWSQQHHFGQTVIVSPASL